MDGLVVLKLIGIGVLLCASLLAVAVGPALLTNRKGLADRVQRHEERDVVEWNGSIASRHEYFNRVVRLYAFGLTAWAAFSAGILIANLFGPHPAGVARVVAAVSSLDAAISLLAIFGVALAMWWRSERAMAALGLHLLGSGFRRLRSAPFQVNAEFWGAMAVGVAVDVLVVLALRSG